MLRRTDYLLAHQKYPHKKLGCQQCEQQLITIQPHRRSWHDTKLTRQMSHPNKLTSHFQSLLTSSDSFNLVTWYSIDLTILFYFLFIVPPKHVLLTMGFISITYRQIHMSMPPYLCILLFKFLLCQDVRYISPQKNYQGPIERQISYRFPSTKLLVYENYGGAPWFPTYQVPCRIY